MKRLLGPLLLLAGLAGFGHTASAVVCGTTTTLNTNGSNTANYGQNVVSSLNYPCLTIVDPTTTTQAMSVDGSGRTTVKALGNGGATLDTTPGGSAATNAIQVQGVASMTPVQTILQQDPCSGSTAKSAKAINNAASNANLLLVTGTSSKQTYICSINVGPVASAVNVALVEGTTTTNACDTGTAGMAGGATAATGWQFAANGGLTMGAGVGTIAKTATAADNVCLLFSASVQSSGVLMYVQQ